MLNCASGMLFFSGVGFRSGKFLETKKAIRFSSVSSKFSGSELTAFVNVLAKSELSNGSPLLARVT